MSKRTRNIIVLASGLAVLGLLPGVLYHALCNAGMLILQRSYG